MLKEFQDKVVLVTGAGKGIGRAAAEAFASRGAIVAANDISPVNLDETEAHILATGGRVKVYIVDIAKKMPVQVLIQSVLEDWGRLDILVNCAEVAPHQPLLDMDDWDWQRTLDVNLTGAFLLTQIAGRVMRKASPNDEKGGGVIIHIGGRVNNLHPVDEPGCSAYPASKAGLEMFVRQASRELAGYGIFVHHLAHQEEKDIVTTILSICAEKRS